jgi:hypothetical protein
LQGRFGSGQELRDPQLAEDWTPQRNLKLGEKIEGPAADCKQDLRDRPTLERRPIPGNQEN